MRRQSPQFNDEHARRWHDRDAASSYQHRIPYTSATIDALIALISDNDSAVLDVGCGTGNIARAIAPRVSRVDAVDFAPEMIEAGRGLPGGDAANIRWHVAKAEDCELNPPYALVVGGASLHWMDYGVVLPRFARALTERGLVAVVSAREHGHNPWDAPVKEIAAAYTTAKKYVPFDMIPVWEAAGLFEQAGERLTDPVVFEQSVEHFIAGFHALSHLTRAHIDAESFDTEIRTVMARYCPDGVVRRLIRGHLVWGKPLVGLMDAPGS